MVVAHGLHMTFKDCFHYWLDRLVRKAGSVVGAELDSLVMVEEKRALNRMLSIMDSTHRPLHGTFTRQRSVFSGRLPPQSCSTDRPRNSSVPLATRLYNNSQSWHFSFLIDRLECGRGHQSFRVNL